MTKHLVIAWACALAMALPASEAAADPHYLFAKIGQGPASISETVFDPEVWTADASFQMGVPGTDPNARALFASVDSAAGVLDVSGITDAYLDGNRSNAVARLEQRMSFPLSGDLPIVVDAQLLLSGSGSGGYITIHAQLQVGNCLVGLARSVGDEFASSEVVTNGCDDTGVVDWTATGGPGALHITAVYAIKPAAFEIAAEVNGDFGGSVSDIPEGQFHNGGSLTIETQGRNAIYHSDSFLTQVPEPEHGVGAALGAIAVLVRRRRRRSALALAATATMLVLAVEPARAGDGRIEINQTCALAGCFAGDSPGFPVTISTRSSYVLTSDLVVPSADTSGIKLQALGVSLDLNEFAVIGPVTCAPADFYEPSTISCTGGGNGDGIEGNDGARIHNGRVVGAGRFGIFARGSLSSHTVVEDVRVEQNGQGGIYLSNGTVRRAEVSLNGGDGITNSGGGDDSTAAVIEDANISLNKGDGIGMAALIRNVRLTYNGGAGVVFVVAGSHNASVNDSFILRNDGNAISGAGSYRGNEIRSNSTAGGGQVIGTMVDAGGNVVH